MTVLNITTTGFTTRSDIGPAREVTSTEAGVGREEKEGGEGGEGDDERFQDPEAEGGLFAGMVYDKDDEEADRIYEMIEEKMSGRRAAKKEKREQEEAAEYLKNNPRIQERFSDLKRGLTSVTDSEWEKCVLVTLVLASTVTHGVVRTACLKSAI